MEDVKEPVIASLGKVEKQTFNFQKQDANTDTNGTNDTTETNTDTGNTSEPPAKTQGEIDAEIAAKAGTGTKTQEEIDAETAAATIATQPLTDEELKSEYEKRFPTQAALTDEEKQKQADAFEKRMLDLYVEGGGKIEEFALLKQVAGTDLTELSKAELTKELKAAGFNETEISVLQKERLEQLSEEESKQFEDESEKDFQKRKREYDKNQIESRGATQKENAVDFFNNLKEAVNQKDFFTKRENEFSSNVDEHFSKLERKMTLQLGQIDNIEIAPVEYEVPKEIIDKAREILSTPASRKQLLFNKDGSLNHINLANLVLESEMFKSGTAAKTAYLEGGHRQVEIVEKILPFRSAAALGLNGSQPNPNENKGKIASVGKVQKGKMPVLQN